MRMAGARGSPGPFPCRAWMRALWSRWRTRNFGRGGGLRCATRVKVHALSHSSPRLSLAASAVGVSDLRYIRQSGTRSGGCWSSTPGSQATGSHETAPPLHGVWDDQLGDFPSNPCTHCGSVGLRLGGLHLASRPLSVLAGGPRCADDLRYMTLHVHVAHAAASATATSTVIHCLRLCRPPLLRCGGPCSVGHPWSLAVCRPIAAGSHGRRATCGPVGPRRTRGPGWGRFPRVAPPA